MKKNKHIGSSFEDFLQEEGVLEEANAAALKRIIAHHVKIYMEENDLTQEAMAKLLKTSRPGLKRLLDPENYSVTLLTFNRAATILGKKIHINLSDAAVNQRVHAKTKK